MVVVPKSKAEKAAIGKPVSGRTWKVSAKRSSAKGQGNFNWKKNLVQKRKAEKQKMEEVKQKEKEMLEAVKDRKIAMAKKREAKRKRKEENEFRSSQYEVIKNTKKLTKMSKKAKRSVIKMSSDQIQRIIEKKVGKPRR